MGRHASGWRLRKKGDLYYVRFTVHRQERELATGESDAGRAAEAAAALYAHAVAHGPVRRGNVTRGTSVEKAGESWLNAIRSTLDADTIAAYATSFAVHLAPFFGSLDQVTPARGQDYVRARLKLVQASTVRKELSALRGMLEWLYGDEAPRIKGPAKRSLGTKHTERRRVKAPPVTHDEARRILALLPVRGRWGWPVRARFVVQFETTIRPEALNLLETPLNYRPGDTSIRLTPEQDKLRTSPEVPLSAWAQSELSSVCPAAGLIFGDHDYRPHVRRAAKLVLSADRAAIFCGAHFRSAGITRYAGENPLVAQIMAGHSSFTTTAGYVKASLEMARAHIAGKKSGKRRMK